MEAKKERGQFYCDVCDCELKDSANYLDHINGKRHNRNKGINLKEFTDSTLDEVRAMLQKKRMERDERLSNENKASDTTRDIPGQHEDEEEEDEDDVDDDDDDEDEPDDDDENHEEEDA